MAATRGRMAEQWPGRSGYGSTVMVRCDGPIGSEFQVNTTTSGNQQPQVAVASTGGLWWVWQE
jgi:hypothetical protein